MSLRTWSDLTYVLIISLINFLSNWIGSHLLNYFNSKYSKIHCDHIVVAAPQAIVNCVDDWQCFFFGDNLSENSLVN
jgi:hypothetical protein